MGFLNRLLFTFAVICFVSGCGHNNSGEHHRVKSSSNFDQNSWKSEIHLQCKLFFDGCNSCRRGSKPNLATCTKKTCIDYHKPQCLDTDNKHTLAYICKDKKGFTIALGDYQSDGDYLTLNSNTLMFLDLQTKRDRLLTREISSYEDAYSDSEIKLTFLGAGNHATVEIKGAPLYQNCSTVLIGQ